MIALADDKLTDDVKINACNQEADNEKIMMATLFMGVMMQASAGIEVYEFKTSEDETRYRALIEELRCPKCQNQNLAGSDAPIALDLKQKPTR